MFVEVGGGGDVYVLEGMVVMVMCVCWRGWWCVCVLGGMVVCVCGGGDVCELGGVQWTWLSSAGNRGLLMKV